MFSCFAPGTVARQHAIHKVVLNANERVPYSVKTAHNLRDTMLSANYNAVIMMQKRWWERLHGNVELLHV